MADVSKFETIGGYTGDITNGDSSFGHFVVIKTSTEIGLMINSGDFIEEFEGQRGPIFLRYGLTSDEQAMELVERCVAAMSKATDERLHAA